MAIKKVKMRPPGYTDVIYPETSADIVIETIDKKIMTASERVKIGLINETSSGLTTQFLKGDGTWGTPPNDNTTYEVFTSSENGLTPKSDKVGDKDKFLKGDGTWDTPDDTITKIKATGGTANTGEFLIEGTGLISTEQNNNTIIISTIANNYTHPTGDGNLHVPATSTNNNGKVLTAGATAGSLNWGVVPVEKGMVNAGYLTIWDGTAGKISSGYTVQTTLTSSATAIPRADAVKTYVDNVVSAADAMVFKGTIGVGGTIQTLPTTYKAGWTYKVVSAGTYVGQPCEIGDMIIAVISRNGSENQDSDWAVVQANIDGAVSGPSISTNETIPVFNGTSGRLIKDSGKTLNDLATSTHTHGNISNDGKIGTTSDLIVKTTTGGLLTTLAKGSSGQFLQFDGTWETPPNDNTTYSVISEAEITVGAATTARTITGARIGYLKNNIIQVGGTQPANGWWFEEI